MHSSEWPIRSTPYKVQSAAIKAAGGRKRFAYFMEMGMGKTQIVLAEFEIARRAGAVNTLVVVCPKPLISVWQNEIENVSIRLPVYIKPTSNGALPPSSIVIYNIDSIIAKAGEVIPNILTTHDVFFALDESITIKNFQSKRWKEIKRWGWSPRVTRILSGYPQVQSPLDYYTQLSLVGGSVPGGPYAFRNRYCILGGWKNKEIKGVKNEQKLADIIASVSFQAKKKDWLDLPAKIYSERFYELSASQQTIYNEMLTTLEADINGQLITVEQALHRTMKLQQIGSGFMIDEASEVQFIHTYKNNPKFKALKDIISTFDTKAIVFAHYKATVNQLVEMLEAPFIRGGMTQEEIEANVDQFNRGSARFIVCQLQSALYGFTLLGTRSDPCSTSIYFENTYSLNARVQSEDRNHRIGQHFPVNYIDLIGTDVENNVVKRLQAKKKLADLIMALARRKVA